MIMRLFCLSCRPFFLMYAHSFFVTSVRGIAFAPTTIASAALGIIGFMNAAFGFRLEAFFFAAFFATFFFGAAFFATFFFATFFFAAFFFAAIFMAPF